MRRALLLAAVALLALSAVAAARPPRPHKPRRPSPDATRVSKPKPKPTEIALENALPGTPGWLGPTATDRAIEVYASATDALPGDTVPLHVSVTAGSDYRILVYRLGWYGGVGARQVACLPSCTGATKGSAQPMTRRDDMSAGWPVTDQLPVDSSWVSGYYLIRAILLNGPQVGSSATTYVVVGSTRRDTRMLVQVPVNTGEAYNPWSGRSSYDLPGLAPRAHHISFDRPFLWQGIGGQGPRGWEIPFVRFVERNGYDVAYQSDEYTDAHPGSLLDHALVVVPGHSEYWTRAMRTAFETARDHAVNLAFMGANAVYWQVRYEDDGRTLVAHKSLYDPEPVLLRKTAMFREVGERECALIGIQHQGADPLSWQPGDYTVTTSALADPCFAKTGFFPGDVVPGVVSVESDSIPASETVDHSCGHALTVLFHRELGGDRVGNADATRYTAPSGAIVFASGSHQFAWGLDDFVGGRGSHDRNDVDPRLQAFMKNALDAMTR